MPADIIVNHCDTNGIYFNQDGAMAAYPAAIASGHPRVRHFKNELPGRDHNIGKSIK